MAGLDAHSLASTGRVDELRAWLSTRPLSVNDVKTTGIFRGHTLLHRAAAQGQMAVCAMLLGRGVNTGICTPKGQTAAQIALDRGHTSLAMWLEQQVQASAPHTTGPRTPTTSVAQVPQACVDAEGFSVRDSKGIDAELLAAHGQAQLARSCAADPLLAQPRLNPSAGARAPPPTQTVAPPRPSTDGGWGGTAGGWGSTAGGWGSTQGAGATAATSGRQPQPHQQQPQKQQQQQRATQPSAALPPPVSSSPELGFPPMIKLQNGLRAAVNQGQVGIGSTALLLPASCARLDLAAAAASADGTAAYPSPGANAETRTAGPIARACSEAGLDTPEVFEIVPDIVAAMLHRSGHSNHPRPRAGAAPEVPSRSDAPVGQDGAAHGEPVVLARTLSTILTETCPARAPCGIGIDLSSLADDGSSCEWAASAQAHRAVALRRIEALTGAQITHSGRVFLVTGAAAQAFGALCSLHALVNTQRAPLQHRLAGAGEADAGAAGEGGAVVAAAQATSAPAHTAEATARPAKRKAAGDPPPVSDGAEPLVGTAPKHARSAAAAAAAVPRADGRDTPQTGHGRGAAGSEFEAGGSAYDYELDEDELNAIDRNDAPADTAAGSVTLNRRETDADRE
jgi:hypothetical protein